MYDIKAPRVLEPEFQFWNNSVHWYSPDTHVKEKNMYMKLKISISKGQEFIHNDFKNFITTTVKKDEILLRYTM